MNFSDVASREYLISKCFFFKRSIYCGLKNQARRQTKFSGGTNKILEEHYI